MDSIKQQQAAPAAASRAPRQSSQRAARAVPGPPTCTSASCPVPPSSLAAGARAFVADGGTCHKASGPTKTRPDRHQTRQPIPFSHGLAPRLLAAGFPSGCAWVQAGSLLPTKKQCTHHSHRRCRAEDSDPLFFCYVLCFAHSAVGTWKSSPARPRLALPVTRLDLVR